MHKRGHYLGVKRLRLRGKDNGGVMITRRIKRSRIQRRGGPGDDVSAIFCETIMLLAAKMLVSDSSRAVWQSFVSLCEV